MSASKPPGKPAKPSSRSPSPPSRPGPAGQPPRQAKAPAPAAARRPGPAPRPPAPEPAAPPEGWADQDLEHLQDLLDQVPAPLEPLDVSMLDGFLVGVILQPRPVPLGDWWRWVLDSEGRPAPARYDGQPLLALVQRRQRELQQAIAERQWFDPWVFELDESDNPSETVLPWVAGFGLAADVFPGLMGLDEGQLMEPLAQLYMHLDPEDLEDADALLEEIESLEPPADLNEAVECLVRASLLLADISQPRPSAPARRPAGPRRGPPPRRPR